MRTGRCGSFALQHERARSYRCRNATAYGNDVDVDHSVCARLCNWRGAAPARMLRRFVDALPNLELSLGLPALAALLLAFAYVRRIARRDKARKLDRRRGVRPAAHRSLSQRSEMRAGEDPSTVMESIARAPRTGPPVTRSPKPPTTQGVRRSKR